MLSPELGWHLPETFKQWWLAFWSRVAEKCHLRCIPHFHWRLVYVKKTGIVEQYWWISLCLMRMVKIWGLRRGCKMWLSFCYEVGFLSWWSVTLCVWQSQSYGHPHSYSLYFGFTGTDITVPYVCFGVFVQSHFQEAEVDRLDPSRQLWCA